jgi:hypothetical protein
MIQMINNVISNYCVNDTDDKIRDNDDINKLNLTISVLSKHKLYKHQSILVVTNTNLKQTRLYINVS